LNYHPDEVVESVTKPEPLATAVTLLMNTWTNGTFTVTCDPDRIDLDVVADFLATSYWAPGIPRAVVQKAIAHSLCFVLIDGDQQVGFARVISDHATFAYLADVFVVPAYRGRGLSKWLMECVVSHSELQGLRRWMLATRDAHALYERVGFTPLKKPEMFMERHRPNVYLERRDEQGLNSSA
jgi:GNAT superfamily N-acetyltransferase